MTNIARVISEKSEDILDINVEADDILTDFAKTVLEDRYLCSDESYQDLFMRVAKSYSDDKSHASRLYQYMSRLWFMPATPILSNGGTERGLPISCFLNETEDSLEGIVSLWNENVWLSSKGGGIGSYWGNLRAIGEKVKGRGKTSGIIPFIVVQNALTLAISQGSLRRGSGAVYLPIWHPEIEEFIDLRKPVGGDPNRKALNLHHGVVISNAFMQAVENGDDWDLYCILTRDIYKTVKARDLWIKILIARIETGEPYIIYIDHVNDNVPEIYKRNNMIVKMSNLCTEIMLTTGKDHLNNDRTAVCCLSSVNLERYDEWKSPEIFEVFIEDIMRFLDNVLEDFIKRAPDDMAKAKYSAMRERSVGLGVMGFHSLLQKKMIPFESPMAKALNVDIFKKLKSATDSVSIKLAKEKGACEDAKDLGIEERFTHKIAIAPTASISIICGSPSPGIEPSVSNVFSHRTLTGSFIVRNKHLGALLELKGKNTEEVWDVITSNEGSVKDLDFLTDYEKSVFKTAYELDQRWVIEHAADRTPYICQSQSLNIFLHSDIHKKILHDIHMFAWKKNVKSLYYLRSLSLQRVDKISIDPTKDGADIGIDDLSTDDISITNNSSSGRSCSIKNRARSATIGTSDDGDCLSCE